MRHTTLSRHLDATIVFNNRPVLWKGELLRFESVRGDYNSPSYPVPSLQPSGCPGSSCYRFRSVATLAVTPAFGASCGFGCAYVQKGSSRSDGVDTMWAFGNCANEKQQNVSVRMLFLETRGHCWGLKYLAGHCPLGECRLRSNLC